MEQEKPGVQRLAPEVSGLLEERAYGEAGAPAYSTG